MNGTPTNSNKHKGGTEPNSIHNYFLVQHTSYTPNNSKKYTVQDSNCVLNGALYKNKGYVSLRKFLLFSHHKISNQKFFNVLQLNNLVQSSSLIKHYHKLTDDFLSVQNAGGPSEYSEFMGAILFQTFFNATNIMSEGNIINMFPHGYFKRRHHSPPDIVTTINNVSVLISVTRYYPKNNAYSLMSRKIDKANHSITCTSDKLNVAKCILLIFCKTKKSALVLNNAYNSLKTSSNVYVYTVICNDDAIYTNKYS